MKLVTYPSWVERRYGDSNTGEVLIVIVPPEIGCVSPVKSERVLQWCSWQSFDWKTFFSEARDLNWTP
jgi:hypothetical protein